MSDSESMPIWEVDLDVDGPVALERGFQTNQQKGYRIDDPFYSSIDFKPGRNGFAVTLTARASDADSAKRAAVTFFGQMLDALVFKINEPLVVSTAEQGRPQVAVNRVRHGVRRKVDHEDFINAFSDAKKFRENENYRVWLRSLGWYRKGLCSENPLDAFLACWNSIELVASSYCSKHPSVDKERAKKGSESQIWECFKAVWGECCKWPFVTGDSKWIENGNKTRVSIAHATEEITPEFVGKVDDMLADLKLTAYRFLRDWHSWLESSSPVNRTIS